ncbi:MAG: hypothetical protein O2907_09635 [Proteobacteria bacterium]|nr:hypothetical protein [Pseudomonadota bacterium]MDA1064567.1 hypothetical protein [Pseudomonadota bacterium]
MTLLLTISAFAVISYTILSVVISPAFDDLELEAARTDLVRAQRALNADVQNLVETSADWALWDDIYNYAIDGNLSFRNTNLIPWTLPNLDLDMMTVYAVNRELLWSDLRVDGSVRDISELGILDTNQPAASRLLGHQHQDDRVAGVVHTELGPMIVSARPILRSDHSGPNAGSLVIGKFLDDSALTQLRNRTEMNLDWIPFGDFPSQSKIDVADLMADAIHVETGSQYIASHVVLRDIFNEPALVLSAETTRKISALGRQTVRAAMIFLFWRSARNRCHVVPVAPNNAQADRSSGRTHGESSYQRRPVARTACRQ